MAAEAIDSLTSLLPRRSDLRLQDRRRRLISTACACALVVGLVTAAAVCVLAQRNRSLEPGYSVPAEGGGKVIVFPAAYRSLFQQPTRPAPLGGTSAVRGREEHVTQDAPLLVDRDERWKLVRVTRRRRSRTRFASAFVEARTESLPRTESISTAGPALPSINGTVTDTEVSGLQRDEGLEATQRDNVSASFDRPYSAATDASAATDQSAEPTATGEYRARSGNSDATGEATQFSTNMTPVAFEKPAASLISAPPQVSSGGQQGQIPGSPSSRKQRR